MSTETKTECELKEALAEGLDLCVRARKIDEQFAKFDQQELGRIFETRCCTPHLWIIDQYDKDLSTWEQKSRQLLTRLS